MSSKLINIIALVITAAWSISFVLDAMIPTYDPPSSVHALMLIVAGAAFTGTAITSARKGGDK